MYERTSLGFSLKPPKWLREAGQQIIGGLRVSVPTPVGPVVLTPGQAAAAARGATVTYTPQQPQSFGQQVQQIPGGWGTLAAVGIGAVVLLTMLRRR